MTQDSAGTWKESDEVAFRAALISRGPLSSESVEQIMLCMKDEDLSFGDAAQKLGLVTAAEVEDAVAYAQMAGPAGTPGLVEAAMRELASSRRDVILSQNPAVKPGPKLTIAHDPYSTHSEKVRALRTDILLLTEARTEAAVIAIVSARPGEGRSQLAAELAISFAQLGRKTLLVDADLRKPSLHSLFGTVWYSGLSEALANESKPILHPVTDLPNLSLLTSGAPAPNPLERLSDGRFHALIATIRKEYDFIVVDTPPLVPFADGLAISAAAGRAIFVTRADRTTYADSKSVLRRLESTQATVLGAVLNRF